MYLMLTWSARGNSGRHPGATPGAEPGEERREAPPRSEEADTFFLRPHTEKKTPNFDFGVYQKTDAFVVFTKVAIQKTDVF